MPAVEDPTIVEDLGASTPSDDPSDVLNFAASNQKALQNALSREGFNPRKVVYLPVGVDPENKGSKSNLMGLSIPAGTTWRDFRRSKKWGHMAVAMDDFIRENYQGEDREWMQRNAQYVNSWTIDPKNTNRINTVAHESAHNAFASMKSAGLMMNFERKSKSEIFNDEELMIRLLELRTGNEKDKEFAKEFLSSMTPPITPEQLEESHGEMLDFNLRMVERLK